MGQSLFEKLKAKVAAGLMVRTHSARVRPGEVFVALQAGGRSMRPGSMADGHDYVMEAVDRGAAWIVAKEGRALPPGVEQTGVVVVRHPNPREALGVLAAAYFDTADLPFPVVGVTGTNGKTTVSYLLEHLFKQNGQTSGVIGTISYRWPGVETSAPLTTPDCWQLHEMLAKMAEAKVDMACMEVSSHALDQDRVAGVDFDAAVFTNLSQDHLDYHQDMDAYFRAKAKIFRTGQDKPVLGVINWDDDHGRVLLRNHTPCFGFGLMAKPMDIPDLHGLQGKIVENSVRGLELLMSYGGKVWSIRSPMVGAHNASNLLAAQALGLCMGFKPNHFKALSSFPGVPGRLERVDVGDRKFSVFVDYAHTPDALEKVLWALRELKFERLITVFGCGGNRDRAKRPLMAQAVARHSDIAVLTSDNPRHEDPMAIMDDIRPGLVTCPDFYEEPDRRKALGLALSLMRKGDVMLVAGKGHENYQQIGDEKLPFSDQAVIKEFLA